MRPFVQNEDHFSSLVLKRTKSSIEDLLAHTGVISADNRRFLSFMYPTSVGVQPGPLKLSKLNTTYEF